MPSKNDLTSLKTKPKTILSKDDSEVGIKKLDIKSEAKPSAGRPPKPTAEKESFPVGMRFTEDEGAILQKKAGLVPLATYLKVFLRERTDIFSK